MNLVIDIGNTALKAAVFESGILVQAMTLNPDDEVGFLKLTNRFNIRRIICSTVAVTPQFIRSYLEDFDSVIWMGPEVEVPVVNAYASPATLGNDRMANACGALYLYPGNACLVIDLGTCLKFDFLGRDGIYKGGSIAPGMRMRYRALQAFTARLPLVEASEEADLVGSTTEESILSGVQNGMLCEMEGMVGKYRETEEGLKVLVTGGDAGFFIKRFKSSIFAIPSLTLIGLNAILEHQHIHEK